MHISSAGPSGVITNLNLLALPAWRIEIIGETQRTHQGEKIATGKLGIGIRYVIPPTTTFAYIAAIDTRAVGGETMQIAGKGLPYGEKIADKEAFIESLQMLNNAEGLKSKDIAEILKTAPELVDIYYDILEGLQSGEFKSGNFLDWRWCLRPQLTGLNVYKKEESLSNAEDKQSESDAS